jgi:hypothetical protein
MIYVVNKLVKFSKCPGQKHFEALFHLLRYLQDKPLLEIKFYSSCREAPLITTLKMENLLQEHPFFSFSDSFWNDDVNHGRSTGCYIITCMGGIVDHSSNLPDSVALSSAEVECN